MIVPYTSGPAPRGSRILLWKVLYLKQTLRRREAADQCGSAVLMVESHSPLPILPTLLPLGRKVSTCQSADHGKLLALKQSGMLSRPSSTTTARKRARRSTAIIAGAVGSSCSYARSPSCSERRLILQRRCLWYARPNREALRLFEESSRERALKPRCTRTSNAKGRGTRSHRHII